MANMVMTKTPMPEQDPNVRNKNFKEVTLGYTKEMAMEEAKRCLSLVGAPTEPEHIGLTKQQLADCVLDAQHIRRRFTILDLTVRTGKFEEWSRNIFG